MNFASHKPVLLQEILGIFNPQPGEVYIDATINGGGHAEAILKRIGPKGKVLGIDWDSDLIARLKNQKAKNLIPVCDNYKNIKSVSEKHKINKINGIIFDLGFSSYHIEKSGRGFSFLKDEPLDMRYNPNKNELTAEKIINTWPEKAIEDILREYGEERLAGNIAGGIVRSRVQQRITQTSELVKIISRSVPRWYLKGRLNPATRTFQALRIAVNGELDNLIAALKDSAELLAPQGKIIVISFHSLEDRIVKQFFKEKEKEKTFKILTSKPIQAGNEERKINPRARSARLRAAQKL